MKPRARRRALRFERLPSRLRCWSGLLTGVVLGITLFLAILLVPRTARAEERCDEGSMSRVYERSKGAIVRIERPDGGLGTGFLFMTPKHVLTAFHVVDLGRGLNVKFMNGRRMGAIVVAVDTEHDLALLELDTAVLDAPVLPAHVDLAVGMKVFAIGNPYGDASDGGNLEGLLNYSTTEGAVSAFNADMLQTDTLLAPGNSGGPLFACDGGVVGVADLLLDNRIGFAVRIHRGLELAGKLSTRKATFGGTISLRDGTLGAVVESDVWDYVGLSAGGRVVAYDRLSLDARLGALLALPRDTSDPVVSRTAFRGTAEVAVGYRALFFPYSFPTYATLSLGGAASLDRGTQRSLQITYATPGCPGAASCAPQLTGHEESIRGGGVAPMASLHVTFAAFDLGYAYKLDVVHPSLSTQRVYVGILF